MTAPSIANNKQEKIGQYRKISEIDLTDLYDIQVIKGDAVYAIKSFVKEISLEYRNQVFKHQHVTTDEHREEIRAVYQNIKSQYTCAPLYNGNKHSHITDWNAVTDADFDSDLLTGIKVRLGKQKDGSILCSYDIDKPSEEFRQKFEERLADYSHLNVEKTVSNGYHILFKVSEDPDIECNRRFPDKHGKIELLCDEHQGINIAPTCSFVKEYDFSISPVYGTSRVLSSDILNIPIANIDGIRNEMNSLETMRRENSKNDEVDSARLSQQNEDAMRRIYDYGTLSEIDRSIKRIYPDPEKLFQLLDIEYLNDPAKSYVRFYSLKDDDGHNLDAFLYYNNQESEVYNWAGYSVQDFHNSGKTISFVKYLAMFDAARFKKLMDEIGFSDDPIDMPIDLEYKGETVNITCGQFLSHERILEQINKVLQNSSDQKQSRIVITAPTGTGKTESFYWMAEQGKIKMILALSYTSQVLQGKAKHTIPGVIGGMCEEDKDVPTGSIAITYDKSRIVCNGTNPEEYKMVIDEAHNLVNHSEFRSEVLSSLKKHSDLCQMAIFVTATPEYLNFKNVDLLIKIELKDPVTKNATVVKYEKKSMVKLTNFIIEKHSPGTIDVVYARSIEKLGKMEAIIRSKYTEIETQSLNAKIKMDSQVYSNISQNEHMSGVGVFETGGILFTTNLIVDGVNIKDQNVGNVYLLDIASTTDLVQYPSRFRNGYQNYFIFISGNKPKYTRRNRTRQQLLQTYYKLSLKYKESYDRINLDFNRSISNILPAKSRASINLTDRYELLDDNGNILEEMILLKVQEIEAARMLWDVSFIKEYLENPAYGYNFQVIEYGKNPSSNACFTPDEIDLGLKVYQDEKDKIIDLLMVILKDSQYERNREELIKDYLNPKTCNPYAGDKKTYFRYSNPGDQRRRDAKT